MKKRRKSSRALAINFTKKLDKYFDFGPNIYRFLIENGVSDGIAEGASELFADYKLEITEEIRKQVVMELVCAIEEIENRVEEALEPIQELMGFIESGIIR